MELSAQLTGLAIVAAFGRGGVIGLKQRLPWRLPTDLKRFRKITQGGVVVMGGQTFRSIGSALSGRDNYVVSRSLCSPIENVRLFRDIDLALSAAEETEKSVFVIGGAQIYRQTFERASHLILTRVDSDAPGDVSFSPFANLDQDSDWRLVEEEQSEQDTGDAYPMCFLHYRRVEGKAIRS